MKTIAITVKGKVQGVWFRHFTKQQAEAIGITGTVRNLENGEVFIIATGEVYQLQDFIHYCRTGPARAEVTDLVLEDLPHQSFLSFEIIR